MDVTPVGRFSVEPYRQPELVALLHTMDISWLGGDGWGVELLRSSTIRGIEHYQPARLDNGYLGNHVAYFNFWFASTYEDIPL
jgi:hypothetical protein